MNDAPDFSKFVPGFNFLQNLAQSAGAAMPGFNQWVAPTLDPDEIDKRIKELRTVQFWLEQNSRLLATTIQALEVQRMTLSTLKTMNVQMGDLRESLKIRMPAFDAALSPKPAQASANAPTEAAPAGGQLDAVAAEPAKATAKVKAKSTAATTGGATAAVDPTQWWNALAGQFAQIAGNAMKNVPVAAKAETSGAPTKATSGSARPAAKSAAAPRKKSPARPRKAATRRPVDKT